MRRGLVPLPSGTSPSALNVLRICRFSSVSERILNSTGFRIGLVASFLLVSGVLPEMQAQVPQQVITTNAESAMSVHATDLTGDGAPEVLSASLADDKIAWYENQVGEDETDGFGVQKVITTDVELAEDVHTTDVDDDGDADVLSASSFDGKLAWYENRIGESSADSDGFGPQKTITTGADGAQSVYASDLDGDGDSDILTAASTGDKIAWYENQIGEGGDGFGSEQVITTSAKTAYSVFAADLDGDGDPDVLSASSFDDKVAWYENQIGEEGADEDGFGDQQVITTGADGAVAVYATDLDGDGDADVLSASSYDDRVAWYENQMDEPEPDSDGFGAQKTITTEAIYASSVFAKDLDGDGDADILSASRSDDRVAWHENQMGEAEADSDGFGPQKTITTDAAEVQSVHATDLNGNGLADVLSASSNDDKVAWYENTDGTLPVELISFEGRAVGGGTAMIIWQTATENQNAGFEVQRQAGENAGWRQVGYVESKAEGGTTTETKSYQYTAEDLPVGTHQFRLKQVDLDGSSTLMDPVSVDIQMQDAVKLTAPTPNPVSSMTTLSFAVQERAKTTITLYSTLGRQVATVYEGTPQAGEQQTARVDASGLSSGTYFLYLETDGQTRTQRLTVVR